jgi:hypothetical protein
MMLCFILPQQFRIVNRNRILEAENVLILANDASAFSASAPLHFFKQ